MTPKTMFMCARIKTITEMAEKTGLTRQMCHLLWHKKRPAGRESALAIEAATGIPLALIFHVLNGPSKRNRKVTTTRS